MRIAISGTASVGKSTLIKDFLAEWPSYKTETKTYRDVLKEEKLPHSKKATKDTQWKILNHMVDELQRHGKNDKVVFDRCPLDNLVYSLWCMEKQSSDIDKEFIDKCIPMVRESMRHLDIIFFIPITKVAPIKIESDGTRETDSIYVGEIDAIFKALHQQQIQNAQKNPFFPADDSPAIIEVFGNRQERTQMIKLYLDTDGDLIGGDATSADNLFNPANLAEMEKLLNITVEDTNKENAYKHELEKIKTFVKETKKAKKR